MGEYYKLNEDHSLTEVSTEEWAKAFEDRDSRRVGYWEFADGGLVSTVFLGMDHAFIPCGAPLLFETMIFQGNWTEKAVWRYSTWDEAAAGHEKAVNLVKRYTAEGRDLNDIQGEEF